MHSQQLGIFGSIIAPEVDIRILEVSHGDLTEKKTYQTTGQRTPRFRMNQGRYKAVRHNGHISTSMMTGTFNGH